MAAVAAAAVIGVAAWALMRRRSARGKPEAGPGEPRPLAVSPRAQEDAPAAPARKGWDVRPRDLVDFFLSVYKVQLGVDEGAPTEVAFTETGARRGVHVCEFKVNRKGKWAARRMTIAPIGEEAKSKSRLYLVIFDTHIVVKVPPRPVTEFSRYLAQIRKETAVAGALAPRECVVPRLSVILRLVHPLAGASALTPEKMEARYIQLAGQTPRLTDFLKIRGSFLFFMELSTRFFLADVLRELHDTEDRMAQELVACPEVLSDPVAGSGRYGEESLAACLGIQSVYGSCREAVARAFGDLPGNPPLPHKLPEWFLQCVAGRCPDGAATGLAPDAHQALETALLSAMKEHPYAVGTFREAVRDHVRRVSFAQRRPKIEGIAANLLALLAWLEEKKVAARDLKPDNLLVVGDEARYPGFLTEPDRFEIGLIDLETAVRLDPPAEPPPAGTPLYATPVHMMGNDMVERLFGDVALALHMEDWYAVSGMIFAAATGEPLFPETARRLPGIVQAMQSPVAALNDPAHYAREACRLFWESATAELSERCARFGGILRAVTVRPPAAAASFLARHLERAADLIFRDMEAFVAARSASASPEAREKLMSAPADSVERRLSGMAADEASGARVFLSRLFDYKTRIALLRRAAENPAAGVPAADLIPALFWRVRSVLFDEGWGRAAPEDDSGEKDV